MLKKRTLGRSALRTLWLILPPLAGVTTIFYQIIDLLDIAARNLWQYLYQVNPFDFLQELRLAIFCSQIARLSATQPAAYRVHKDIARQIINPLHTLAV